MRFIISNFAVPKSLRVTYAYDHETNVHDIYVQQHLHIKRSVMVGGIT